MAELKTHQTDDSVQTFIGGIADDEKRADAQTICDIMQEISGEPPKMWGSSIVGFGLRHLKYASGRELDWMIIGFSPRKANLTLYITEGYDGYQDLLARLGKHSIGKSCLYIKKLSDVDIGVVRELISKSIALSGTKSPDQP